jgi:hypothetical protein
MLVVSLEWLVAKATSRKLDLTMILTLTVTCHSVKLLYLHVVTGTH